MSSTPDATQLQGMLTNEIATWKNSVNLNSLLQSMQMNEIAWKAVSREYKHVKLLTDCVGRLNSRLDEAQQEYYSVCSKLANVPNPAILLNHCKDVIESQSRKISQLSSTIELLNRKLQESEKMTVEYKSKAFSEMVNVTDPTTLFTHCKDIIDSSSQQKLQLLSTVELLNRGLQESEKLNEEFKLKNQELTVAGTALSNEEREELINLRKEAALSNEEREELINFRKESAEYEVVTSNH